MNAFLTDAEVEDLTGYSQSSRQAAALRKMRIAHQMRPTDGKVRVTWDQVNRPDGGETRRRPNLEAARG